MGIVGLHEGLTLLKALTHTVPDALSVSRPAQDGEPTRSHFAYAAAACDQDEAKCARARQVAPGTPTTTHFDDLLSREDVAIVAIYTPDASHGELIERAMRAGKHVICTKPLVVTVAEAGRIRRVAEETGMRLQVGQSTRFFPPFAQQRAAFERGVLGGALASIGIPENSVLEYEAEIKAGKFLLLARGSGAAIELAKSILGGTDATRVNAFEAREPVGHHH